MYKLYGYAIYYIVLLHSYIAIDYRLQAMTHHFPPIDGAPNKITPFASARVHRSLSFVIHMNK